MIGREIDCRKAKPVGIYAGKIKKYKIDFDKVKSLEDVINILKGMRITINDYGINIDDNIKPYLKEIK